MSFGRALVERAAVSILIVGAIIGMTFSGLLWLVVYLCHHITIGWIP